MAQRLRRSQVDYIDVIDDIETIDHIEPRMKSGGRIMAQESRGFGDADASLSGFEIGTNGTDRTNKARKEPRFRGNGGCKWLAYSLCGLIMGRYSELQAKKRRFRDDRADHYDRHRHALRHYCAPSARWAVMRQW